jgi:hypothetical protein
LHVGGQLRQKLVTGDTDGPGEESTRAITDNAFDGHRQSARDLGTPLHIVELARHFINRHNRIDRNRKSGDGIRRKVWDALARS